MASTPYDLARMADDDAAAARALPGPDFHQVLKWIHEALRPVAYVEIGVMNGCSLAAGLPGTVLIGIDPNPDPNGRWPVSARIVPLTSTDFFATHNLSDLLGGTALEFAFIDGLHLFEQAVEDLCQLERYLAPGGLIAIHDTIPLNRETASRERTTEFYTGDVWKIVPFLRHHRPEVDIVTVTAAPTGLTLIRGLDPAYDPSTLLSSAGEFAALPFDYFELHRGEFLRTIPNERAAVQDFCQKTPVQSMVSSEAVTPSRRR